MSRNGSAYHRLLNSARWRALRSAQLGRNPFCADCAKTGVLEPATEVHHVIPIETERDAERMTRLAFDPGNLVSLCHDCHHERHRLLKSHSRDERERRVKEEAEAFWKRFG